MISRRRHTFTSLDSDLGDNPMELACWLIFAVTNLSEPTLGGAVKADSYPGLSDGYIAVSVADEYYNGKASDGGFSAMPADVRSNLLAHVQAVAQSNAIAKATATVAGMNQTLATTTNRLDVPEVKVDELITPDASNQRHKLSVIGGVPVAVQV